MQRNFILSAVLLIALCGQSRASVLTWNSAGSGSPTDGGGTWNTTTSSNWWNNVTNNSWVNANNDTAVFGVSAGTTAYTVTLGTATTAGGITFASQNYTIGTFASTLVLTLTGATTPTITMNASAGTINSIITGSKGMLVTGTGALTLSAVNTLSAGTVTVSGGANLILNGLNANGTNKFVLPQAANLAVSNGTVSLNSYYAIHYQSTANTLTVGPNALVIANDSGGLSTNFFNQYWLTNLVMQGGTLAANFPGSANPGGNNYGNFTIFTGGGVTTSGGAPSTISCELGLFPTASTVFNVAADSPLLVSGNIQAPDATHGKGINLTGGGQMTLTGTGNTYTATTTITSGTLNIAGNGVLGSAGVPGSGNFAGTVDVAPGALLNYNSSASQTFSGIISDNGNLNVSAGVVVLKGANTFFGTFGLNGGVVNLAIADSGSVGPLGLATLAFGGGTLQYSSVNNTDYSGRFSTSAGQAYNVDTNGQSVAWNTGLTSTGGSLDKLGGGTLALNGANSYTGATAVNAGKLYINNTDTSSSINVAAGTTLGGSGATTATVNVADGGAIEAGYSGSGSLAVGGLKFLNSGTINIANFANYSTSAAVTVGSAGLTTSGALTLALNGPAPFGSGVAELLQYSGALHGTGSSAFALNTSGVSGLGARALLSLSFSNAGFVKLKYSLDHPVWSGAGDGAWITSPSTTAAGVTNWVLASSPSTATNFILGDAPVFDDTAGTGTTTVKISAANVAPSSVIFNNNSLSYTLTGAFGIAGSGSLTMNGSGSLTIANSNGYTGGTTLNSGLLNINNNSALGSGGFTISGGSIDCAIPGIVLANNPQAWNGDFTFLGSNNLNLGSGSVTLGGNRQVTVNASTLTVGGGISGGFGLTLPGPGSLALTGSSTFTGDTAINGGTLTVGGGGVLGNGSYAGAIGIAGGAVLNYNSSANQTFGGVISGSGNLVAAGPGTLTLSGTNNSFGGNASLTAGALTLNSNSGTAAVFILSGSSSLAVSNGTCSLNSNSAIHFQSTSSTLTVGPNGYVVANNSSGSAANFNNQYWLTNLSMQGGTLAANYPGNSSYGNFTIFTGGAVTTSGGSLSTISAGLGLFQPNTTFNIASDSPLLVSGNITLATAGAGLTMAGPGLMTVTGANTYTGATTISGGTLNVTGASVLGSGSYPGAIDIAGGAALIYSSSANQKFSGVISDAGNLNVSAGSLVLSGSNTISGTITLTGGVVNLGSADTGSTGPLGSASVVLGGGTLQYSSVNTTDYSGRFGATAGQAFNVDTNGQNVTWNTGLTSTGGSLDKLGGGALTLNGPNTYTGATALNGGKLYLNNTNATSAIAVAGGATLGGSGATSATVNVADGGAIEAGISGSGSLALGGLNFNNTGTINIANFANYSTSAAIAVGGGLSPSGALTINLGGPALAGAGTAELLHFFGAMQGAGSSAFALNTTGVTGLGIRTFFSLSFSNAGFVDLNYNIDHPVWSGAGNGTWITSAGTTATGVTNWVLASNASVATNFIQGDAAVFDDTAGAGTTTVNISAGDVSPASVSFNNNSLSYTLTGAFGITGSTSLAVNGLGSLTIANSNSYTGGTLLNSGLPQSKWCRLRLWAAGPSRSTAERPIATPRATTLPARRSMRVFSTSTITWPWAAEPSRSMAERSIALRPASCWPMVIKHGTATSLSWAATTLTWAAARWPWAAIG